MIVVKTEKDIALRKFEILQLAFDLQLPVLEIRNESCYTRWVFRGGKGIFINRFFFQDAVLLFVQRRHALFFLKGDLFTGMRRVLRMSFEKQRARDERNRALCQTNTKVWAAISFLFVSKVGP